MSTLEGAQVILIRHGSCITEIFDQLQRITYGQNFRALHILNIIRQLFHVAVVRDQVAVGILGSVIVLHLTRPQLAKSAVYFSFALLDLITNFEAFTHIFLFSDLKPQNIFAVAGVAIQCKSR